MNLIIEALTEAAHGAIEQAAADAAKAAALDMVEREAAALREAERWKDEADILKADIEIIKSNNKKNVFIGIMAGLLGGLALGITGTILITN
jgi:anti-sigma factor RsiW